MTLRLDYTQYSVVVLCNDCPWWTAFAFDRTEGWTIAARHEQRTHPDQTQARVALAKHHERNALAAFGSQ